MVRWGDGQLVSVDGLRFRVPVKSIHAGHNPKYFGVGSGVTYLNFVSNQFSGFHGIVVPGTLRDSLFVLDKTIEHEHSVAPPAVDRRHRRVVGYGFRAVSASRLPVQPALHKKSIKSHKDAVYRICLQPTILKGSRNIVADSNTHPKLITHFSK